MAGRHPNEAFDNAIRPLRQALQCITLERLILRERRRLAVGVPYAVVLNDMDPVPLNSATTTPLFFRAGQIVRIMESENPTDSRGPYNVRTINYLYAFSVLLNGQMQELLAFHWTPESTAPKVTIFPHVHIGSVLLTGQTVLRPGNLHKGHIPTARLPLEAVIWLGITELGVRPLQPGWEAILQRTARAFLS